MPVLQWFVLSVLAVASLNTYADKLKVDFCEFSTDSGTHITRFDETTRKLVPTKNGESIAHYHAFVGIAEQDNKTLFTPTNVFSIKMAADLVILGSKAETREDIMKIEAMLARLYRSVIVLSVITRKTNPDFSIASPAEVSIAITNYDELDSARTSHLPRPKMFIEVPFKPLDSNNNEISLQYNVPYLANNGTSPLLLKVRCALIPITDRI